MLALVVLDASSLLYLSLTGELKETKAYKKWSKQIAEIKPPTDPLKNRGK